VSNVEVTCVTTKYTVSGTVTGLADTNFLTLFLNGLNEQTVTFPGNTFSFPAIDDGTEYTVSVSTQPDQPDQVCTVQSPAMPGTINGADVTNVLVNCVTTPYTVAGTVTGLATDNEVKLTINGGDEQTVTNPATTFIFPARDDGTEFTIVISQQPDTPSQFCEVTSTNPDTINGGNVTNVTVVCTTDSFTIGGTVAGHGGGTDVVLQINGVETEANGNGFYVFATPLLDETPYTVAVITQPTGPAQTCSFDNADFDGVLAGANIHTVDLTCVND
jgi:hypothetical protein